HQYTQNTYILPALASFFHTCDWNAGRVNSKINQQGGKRIRVQVTATSRHRVGLSHGLRKVRQGRPRKNTQVNDTETTQKLNHSIMPTRKSHLKKRSYNLNWALKENRPNDIK
ncbi:725_t:CDS:1, partial [Dentiscutata heterogama]